MGRESCNRVLVQNFIKPIIKININQLVKNNKSRNKKNFQLKRSVRHDVSQVCWTMTTKKQKDEHVNYQPLEFASLTACLISSNKC